MILVLAPPAVGGLVQLSVGTATPVLILPVIAWLGIAGAVQRIIEDRRPVTGRHVRET